MASEVGKSLFFLMKRIVARPRFPEVIKVISRYIQVYVFLVFFNPCYKGQS
jgi:hypothetical protein